MYILHNSFKTKLYPCNLLLSRSHRYQEPTGYIPHDRIWVGWILAVRVMSRPNHAPDDRTSTNSNALAVGLGHGEGN